MDDDGQDALGDVADVAAAQRSGCDAARSAESPTRMTWTTCCSGTHRSLTLQTGLRNRRNSPTVV